MTVSIPQKIARYTPAKLEKLLADPGIIRHKGKIDASVSNAKAYLALVEREGSFAKFLWSFVGGKPKKNQPEEPEGRAGQVARESDAMSKALQKAGFKFVGSTICYAFMQASGMVDDHVVGCHRSKSGVDLDQRVFIAALGHRDQPVRALPDRPARLRGARHLARRRDQARADQLHRAGPCLAQARPRSAAGR